jgi:hypothetical protein
MKIHCYSIELMGPIESPGFSVKGISDYYQALLTNARYLDRFTNRLDDRITKTTWHQHTGQ